MNAAFFDLDGTLADTRADLAATVNHTRRDLGLAELPVETVVANVGNGARVLLEKSIPEAAGRPFEELRGVFMSHYVEHCCETVALYPGVASTLAELRSRGWLLGVVTNKPRAAVLPILEKFGLRRHFGNAIVAGGDCAELKPSAMPLRECAARMCSHRLSSHDWLVGDNWTDMQCASNAGVRGMFCTFGFGRLGDSRYSERIGSFGEILRHLKAED